MAKRLAIREVVDAVWNLRGPFGARVRDVVEYLSQRHHKNVARRKLRIALRKGAVVEKNGCCRSPRRPKNVAAKRKSQHNKCTQTTFSGINTCCSCTSNGSVGRSIGGGSGSGVFDVLREKWESLTSARTTSTADDSVPETTKGTNCSNSSSCGQRLGPSKSARLLRTRDSLELIREKLSIKSSEPTTSTSDMFSKTASTSHGALCNAKNTSLHK